MHYGLVRDSSAVRRLFVRLTGAVGRQSALHKENSGFAASTQGRHISTFRGYRICFSIRNPYINRFTNHFSIHSFITILRSESGVTLDYSMIFPNIKHLNRVLLKPQGLAVIFSYRQVYVKREGRTLFLLPKVKVEFRHLFSLQKRFSLCS